MRVWSIYEIKIPNCDGTEQYELSYLLKWSKVTLKAGKTIQSSKLFVDLKINSLALFRYENIFKPPILIQNVKQLAFI